MKIKILKSGIVLDAIQDCVGRVYYIDAIGHCRDISKDNSDAYEIIPDPPQAKFKIGQTVLTSRSLAFEITEIHIKADNKFCYCGNITDLFTENELTLHTEPEKQKTYKYKECGQLNGEVIYKKVEE